MLNNQDLKMRVLKFFVKKQSQMFFRYIDILKAIENLQNDVKH